MKDKREKIKMITVEQAKQIIGDLAHPVERTEQIPLEKANGRVLAEDVRLDTDFPPFNRCNMDGYAVDSSTGEGEFEVLEVVAAGAMPTVKVVPGKVSRIMTGAPLPEGADAVVQVEKSRDLGNGKVRLSGKIEPGENVTPKGLEIKKGAIILEKETVLRPQEIYILASSGCSNPKVYSLPTVGVLATGSELLEPYESPSPGKIRNSNSYGLMAQCQAMGLNPHYLGIAQDDPNHLREKIKEGLAMDVLLLTGGMSMGDFDIAPGLLRESGVKLEFERVRIKPGKPVHFGTTEKGGAVFGLPGNPVSTMVIFEQFVKPALRILMKLAPVETTMEKGILKSGYKRRNASRVEYLPVFIAREHNGFAINLIRYFGSGHISALSKANALMRVEAEVGEVPGGAICEFQWL